MTTITGPLRNPVTGALMPGATFSVESIAPYGNDDATYPAMSQVITAAATTAEIALELAAPPTGTFPYVFRIPETSTAPIVLNIADGPPTTLHALIAAQHPAVAPSALATHEGAADPHPGYLTTAEAGAAYQPLDSDLTAIAALATTAYGRALLALADAAAGRTAIGVDAAGTAAGLVTTEVTARALADTTHAALTTTAHGGIIKPPLAMSFSGNGDIYFVAHEAMTLTTPAEAGTGTLAYTRALAAAPTSFSTLTFPGTLATGDILKVTLTGITGYKAATLPRSA